MIPIDFEKVASELTENDEKYQRLYARYLERQENFDRIMDHLSYDDRCDLDDFITACRLMERRYWKLLVNYYATNGTEGFKVSVW